MANTFAHSENDENMKFTIVESRRRSGSQNDIPPTNSLENSWV